MLVLVTTLNSWSSAKTERWVYTKHILQPALLQRTLKEVTSTVYTVSHCASCTLYPPLTETRGTISPCENMHHTDKIIQFMCENNSILYVRYCLNIISLCPGFSCSLENWKHFAYKEFSLCQLCTIIIISIVSLLLYFIFYFPVCLGYFTTQIVSVLFIIVLLSPWLSLCCCKWISSLGIIKVLSYPNVTISVWLWKCASEYRHSNIWSLIVWLIYFSVVCKNTFVLSVQCFKQEDAKK